MVRSGAWYPAANLGPNANLRAVSCSGANSCTTVDNAGHAWGYNGATWTLTATYGSAWDFPAVSCTDGLCAALDAQQAALLR